MSLEGNAAAEHILIGKVNSVPKVDATLTRSGWSADAKVTGDEIRALKDAVTIAEGAAEKAEAVEEVAAEAKSIATTAANTANDAKNAANDAASAASAAQTTADGAMPKAGGTFTGNAVAYGDNRSGEALRNIEVVSGSVEEPTAVSTNKIVMVRK